MGLGFNLYGGDHSGGRLERGPSGQVSSVDMNLTLPSEIVEAFRRAEAFRNFTARLEKGADGSGVVAVTILAWNLPEVKTEITTRV